MRRPLATCTLLLISQLSSVVYCPYGEQDEGWHYEHGSRRWPDSQAAEVKDASSLEGENGLLSCGVMGGVLPNSTARGTVALGAVELQAVVLDTAASAATRVLRCGGVAVRWNTPGVLQQPGNVFAAVRRSVLYSLGLTGDDASFHPPIEISAKDFLLRDHSNRGRDRYEMVIPFGTRKLPLWYRLTGSQWLVWFGFNADGALAELLRRSPALILAASAVLGLPAHVEMISALVAMPGAVEGPLTQPSGPGTDHRVIIDIPLLPQPLHSDIRRNKGEESQKSGTDYYGHDTPSVAICMGDLHKALWQAEVLDVATGSTCSANNQSCSIERAIDKQCKNAVDIIGEGNCASNVKEKDRARKNTLQPDLAASTREDGAAGIKSSELDRVPASESTQVENPYSHENVQRGVCTCSVESL